MNLNDKTKPFDLGIPIPQNVAFMKTNEELHKEYDTDLKYTQLMALAFFKGCRKEQNMDIETALLATIEFLKGNEHSFVKPLQFHMQPYLRKYSQKYPSLNVYEEDFLLTVESKHCD